MMEIKDSGERREFQSGAVRDIAEGKGRCDLLPLDCVSMYFSAIANPYKNPHWVMAETCSIVLNALDYVTWNKRSFDDNTELVDAIDRFAKMSFKSESYALLELSKHYEEGAKKYSERNWQKGIPCHCYIDSCVRHLLKWYDGWDDEPHDRAVLWNLFGLWWTLKNKPECNDLPYKKETDDEQSLRVLQD